MVGRHLAKDMKFLACTIYVDTKSAVWSGLLDRGINKSLKFI